ncbi:MAG TPA: hypothetical protein VHM94_15605, partial [Acidimicrobiia bacterium]|nr:hypothetical protein [Acidimicrobiia bacterium]
YVLTASQGPIRAEVVVEVVLPRDQLMRVKPESAPPGAAMLLGMAGFDPGAEVPLHLYGGSRYDMEYLASLSVEIDDQGQARTQLQTEPSDPPGFYCIFAFGTQSEEFGCDARFELTGPG